MTTNSAGELHRQGRIEVVCGSMFSGKTEELIRRIKRATFARQRVIIFKPQIDNRYSEENVVSHYSNAVTSTPVSCATDILRILPSTGEAGQRRYDIDVVGIDEAQFFGDDLVDVCNELADNNVRVIIAGLDMDFKGKPFGPMPGLCAIADDVMKVHAICVRCGALAYAATDWCMTNIRCSSERRRNTSRSAVNAIRNQKHKIDKRVNPQNTRMINAPRNHIR